MKIYTKTGDKGTTSLLGGKRVSKTHIRIEAYGTIDELNAHLGLLRDILTANSELSTILAIQNNLFTIGSQLAAEKPDLLLELPKIQEENIQMLEHAIDKMNDVLPEMRNFILPGGNQQISFCHIARCICRRAERKVIFLHEQEPVDVKIITLLNRLSDYLFVLARKISFDLNIRETPWKPNA